MRRSDREVRGLDGIIDIINRCDVIHLGLSDGGEPYVVPLNFGFEASGGEITFFFHSAKEGRKIDIMAKNPRASFSMECSCNIIRGENACEWSAEYESVMGSGDISFIYNSDEKIGAMKLIMKKYGLDGFPEFSSAALERTAVYKLKTSEITGKRNVR